MKPISLLLGLICYCSVLHTTHGSNILFLMPITTKSHLQFFGKIATVLADTGHKITAVVSYDIKKHPNITEVNLHIPIDSIFPNSFQYSGMQSSFYLVSKMPVICSEILQATKEIPDFNTEDYDLIFAAAFMHDCFLTLMEHSQVPLIYLNPNQMVTHVHDLAGNVDFPSFVTMMGLTGSHPFSFCKRFINTVANTAAIISVHAMYLPWIEDECKERGVCPQNMKPLAQISNKFFLVMINSVRSLEVPPRPHFPGVIHAGGLNCRPAQPLPEDLESWIAGSGEAGFIYMSLGSVVKPSDMEEEHKRILIEAFGSLKQRVLWKWDQENMEDLPPNVRLAKWLPQQDILGHPKIKLFISHGGLFSMFESIYHAVPVLGMPIFADQVTNIDRGVTVGYAELIHWDQFTLQSLQLKLNKILNDKSYSEVVRQRSEIMRDQPMSPQETVVYWTEYAIRHRGASHLRSPVKDMSWYQVYNIDVWMVLLLSLLTVLLLLMLLVWKLSFYLIKKMLQLTGIIKQTSHATKKTKKQ